MIMDVIFKKYQLSKINEKLWRMIDNDMLENELKVMLKNHENDKVPLLKSNPDFNEKCYKEIEQEFLYLAHQLINEVKLYD